MMKNKRGQGISMNMIIIIILAILVLLVISIIFLGGAGTLNQRLRNIFGGNVDAYSMDLAQSNCRNYCDVASAVPDPKISSYCSQVFVGVDGNRDGTPDVNPYVCDKGNFNYDKYGNNLKKTDGTIATEADTNSIGVICNLVVCKPRIV